MGEDGAQLNSYRNCKKLRPYFDIVGPFFYDNNKSKKNEWQECSMPLYLMQMNGSLTDEKAWDKC